jgi:hypothetical protein
MPNEHDRRGMQMHQDTVEWYCQRYNIENCACSDVLVIKDAWIAGFTERRPGSYAIFGEDSTLLYIGKAKMLAHRLGTRFRWTHDKQSVEPLDQWRTGKPTKVMMITLEQHYEAVGLEAFLIEKLHPRENQQGRLAREE